MKSGKKSLECELLENKLITNEIAQLDFVWHGTPPRAGQFFMIKPQRSSVFLPRPVSAAFYQNDAVRFLIARRGKGIDEILSMKLGEQAQLIGPLGNAWFEFTLTKAQRHKGTIALIGGGIGLAPLVFFSAELFEQQIHFELYAGFRESLGETETLALLGGALSGADNAVLAAEKVAPEHKALGFREGRIPEFLAPAFYSAVFACGPEPMLKAVAASCRKESIPCFASLERRMACGVGACLGCTVETVNGNRRCCADGPIFNAEEVLWI